MNRNLILIAIVLLAGEIEKVRGINDRLKILEKDVERQLDQETR